MKGEVKWYNPEKGYGFIRLDDGNDVFVHHTDLAQKGFRIIWEGQRVSCDIEARPDNGKKKKALNVVVVDDHDWKTRYPKCPVCNGKGTRDNPNSMCHPCEGNGVLSMEGVYALYCSANAAAERRYIREQEWKRQAKRSKGIWNWIKRDSCSSSCRRNRRKLAKSLRRQGRTISYYRKLLDENDIDFRQYRKGSGSITNI